MITFYAELGKCRRRSGVCIQNWYILNLNELVGSFLDLSATRGSPFERIKSSRSKRTFQVPSHADHVPVAEIIGFPQHSPSFLMDPGVAHVINMSNASASTVPSGSSSELGRSPTVVRVSDERFNIQSPQRRILIRQFKKAVHDQEIPTPLWAVFQLCDLEKLEYMAQLARFSLKIIDPFAELICALPFKWSVTPSPSQQRGAAFWSPTFSPRRRVPPVAIYAARERDGHKCVITGTRKIFQTTPIFPASAVNAFLQNDPETPNIWAFADVFWGTSTTSRWKKAFFNDPTNSNSLVNDCSNLICLRRDLRTAWSSGLFALRPAWISDDMTAMEIEFYWQPKPDHKLFDNVDVAKQPPSTKNVHSVDQLIVAVGNRGEPTYRAIESGYRFRMTTDDPILRPLPSFDLLDMQWHFTRLTALCAATSFFDEEDEDDAGSDKTTQPDHPLSSNPPDDDILAWVRSSSLSSDDEPESDFVEDIDASMIGPLPGPDTSRSRAVSESSKSSEKSAASGASVASESTEDSELVDVISGTGRLSLDFADFARES
ncbi:hypothetical protein N7530_007448 [Penicillium desertorum]|uniref:HNH nuclease domain-containing protein n=1 Tax=Penicillium desertorum TaxID=1303715 RepID=A0A9X0BJY2_9EURO|nr:hypothetical protein N7530_007448 [Penicillium desertorum]